MCDNQLSLDGIPDEFMQGQIKVECPYSLQMVYELRITRKLNQHGQIWVKGVLQEEAGKECIHQVGAKPLLLYMERKIRRKYYFFWCCDRCKYILPRLYLLCRNQWIIMEQFIGL